MEYLIIHMDFQTPCKNSLADTCRVCVRNKYSGKVESVLL